MQTRKPQRRRKRISSVVVYTAEFKVDEKKDAFDAYIRYIATTNCEDEESRDYNASISAIEQCCWMSRTNELASMRQFVLNTRHPYRFLITRSVIELGGLDNASTNQLQPAGQPLGSLDAD